MIRWDTCKEDFRGDGGLRDIYIRGTYHTCDLAMRHRILRVKARQVIAREYRLVMAESIEALVSEAMQLPADQRLTLAHRILTSIEPTPSPALGVAWETEIRKRIARYDAGEVGSIPAAEVFDEVDRRLRR